MVFCFDTLASFVDFSFDELTTVVIHFLFTVLFAIFVEVEGDDSSFGVVHLALTVDFTVLQGNYFLYFAIFIEGFSFLYDPLLVLLACIYLSVRVILFINSIELSIFVESELDERAIFAVFLKLTVFNIVLVETEVAQLPCSVIAFAFAIFFVILVVYEGFNGFVIRKIACVKPICRMQCVAGCFRDNRLL